MSGANPFRRLVSYELSMPEFLKRLQCENVEEGDKSCLFCEVIGDPVPKIQWFTEEGNEISETDDRYQMNYNLETGRAELVVKNTQISDEMSYKCIASNEHGTAKTIGVLVIKNYKKKSKSPSPGRSLTPPTQSKRGVSPLKNIEVPISNLQPVKEETEHSSESAADQIPTKPEDKLSGCEIISSPPEKLEVKEGEDFKISCNIIGSPEPEVLWFKDNHPLKDDYRIDIYSDRGIRTLEICNAKLSDAGDYTIFVRNDVKQVNATTKLAIIDNPLKSTERSSTKEMFEYKRKETYRTPQFINKPTDQRIHEGNNLKIFTQVNGIPKPEVSWFKEGKPIKFDDIRYKSYEENERNYFEIENISLLDAGEYTCTASNVMGAIFSSIKISIEAMTEPESSSEFLSDLDKSLNEYASAQGSVSDNNSERSVLVKTKSEKRNKEIAKNLLDKHVTEHIHDRLKSNEPHSDKEKNTLLHEYKLLEDYKDQGREIALFKDGLVEIIDITKGDKWLVRTKFSNIVQVCYVPPELLEPVDKKPPTVIMRKNNTTQQRKQSHKIPKSERILFGESQTEFPKLHSICYTFDDSNTIYTKAGRAEALKEASSILTSESEEKPSSSTIATQLNETITKVKVTEMTTIKKKKYDSSTRGVKTFESKTTESRSFEQKYLDQKVLESKKFESKAVELTAAETKNLETKSVQMNASELKSFELKNNEYTTSESKNMETRLKNTADVSKKHSIEQSHDSSLGSKFNKSLPDLSVDKAAGASKKAASHKKFTESLNRRQLSHESDLNNLGSSSSSSSEDLNKNMAEEADIYYASCDFTTSDLQNASATFLSLLENQFVEILDSQDSRYYLVRTRARKDEKSKIGWIPACFLERKSTSIGQYISTAEAVPMGERSENSKPEEGQLVFI